MRPHNNSAHRIEMPKRKIPRDNFRRVSTMANRHGKQTVGWPLVSWLHSNSIENVLDAIETVVRRGEELTPEAVERQIVADSQRERRFHRAEVKRDRRAA